MKNKTEEMLIALKDACALIKLVHKGKAKQLVDRIEAIIAKAEGGADE